MAAAGGLAKHPPRRYYRLRQPRDSREGRPRSTTGSPFFCCPGGGALGDRYGLAHPKKRAFLANYERTGNITVACDAAGVGRTTYYRWAEHDDAFTVAARQARDAAADYLEEHARLWATEGLPTVKEIYEDGKLVRREESTERHATLLIFLLKGLKPEKYRERYDVSGDGPTPVRVDRPAYDAV